MPHAGSMVMVAILALQFALFLDSWLIPATALCTFRSPHLSHILVINNVSDNHNHHGQTKFDMRFDADGAHVLHVMIDRAPQGPTIASTND